LQEKDEDIVKKWRKEKVGKKKRWKLRRRSSRRRK